jgi:hypothetical protein
MNSDWPLIASAGATLLLAIAAFWSIWQNHLIQKRERKQRLLNEIIEWAIDIAKCESEQGFHTMSLLELEVAKESRKVQYLEADRRTTLINLHQKYQSVDVRSEYVRSIAKRFGDNLQAITDQTADKLREQLIILIKQIKGEIPPEDRDTHVVSLIESALALTKEAAKIKTRDMS